VGQDQVLLQYGVFSASVGVHYNEAAASANATEFGVLQRFADNLQNACSVWTKHNDQSNWRWCHKCQGLYFAGNNAGVCPAGGTHDHTGSGNYRISQNMVVPYGQTKWHWCHKCQGMYFAGITLLVAPSEGAKVAAPGGATAPRADGSDGVRRTAMTNLIGQGRRF
jgi:hypothetical protein